MLKLGFKYASEVFMNFDRIRHNIQNIHLVFSFVTLNMHPVSIYLLKIKLLTLNQVTDFEQVTVSWVICFIETKYSRKD